MSDGRYLNLEGLENLVGTLEGGKLLVVADGSFGFLPIADRIRSLPCEKVFFSGFRPNPLYEEVEEGIRVFRENGCGMILAVGGGSSIDVAKCIKLFLPMNPEENYLQQAHRDPSAVKLCAIPTTAGTGSEETRFAVIYYEGKKQSINDPAIIPDFVCLEPSVLTTLPAYQKKCTYLDALCQAMESRWSVNRTEESAALSREAMTVLSKVRDSYFSEEGGKDPDVCRLVMLGANLAGKAINLTQTTAAHAMSYKLTSLLGIPHGHAVAACFLPCFEHMLRDGRRTVLPGDDLDGILDEIAYLVFGCDREAFPGRFRKMTESLGLQMPVIRRDQLGILAASVNPERLKNHPEILTTDDFTAIYSLFLEKSEDRLNEN